MLTVTEKSTPTLRSEPDRSFGRILVPKAVPDFRGDGAHETDGRGLDTRQWLGPGRAGETTDPQLGWGSGSGTGLKGRPVFNVLAQVSEQYRAGPLTKAGPAVRSSICCARARRLNLDSRARPQPWLVQA